MFLAIVPGGGIAQSTGAPTAAGSTATVFRVDPGGTIVSLGLQTLWNISLSEAVPAAALAVVAITENGHFYCQSWAAQASPQSVIHAAGTPFHKGF